MNNGTEQIFIPNAAPSLSVAPSQSMSALIPPPSTLVNLDNVEDFSRVCRICASITELVMPILSGEGLQNRLGPKIKKYLPITVREEDGLPQVICYPCANTLLAWHELFKCCMDADLALHAKITTNKLKTNPLQSESINVTAKPIASVQDAAQGKAVMPGEETVHEDIIEKPEFTISENGKRYAMCGACRKSVSLSGWTRHARAHRGERRHSCHACGLAFNDAGNLARHVRAIHAKQRPHTCPTCSKTFSRKSHLEDHVKSHSETRTFVCDICGKGSKSSAALRMHARTHDVCRFPCVQCGARFKRRGELSAHMSVHTGEKAHVCHCGKTFRLRSQLTAHSRVHQRTQEQDMEDSTSSGNILRLHEVEEIP